VSNLVTAHLGSTCSQCSSPHSVRVFQLVAEDTVEDRVLDIQKKKEKLISQAFSGNKNAPREKEKIGECFSSISEKLLFCRTNPFRFQQSRSSTTSPPSSACEQEGRAV
jgi:hypothetical protein